MPGLGTLVNVLAIIAGGIIGLTAGRFLTDRLQNGVIMACGLSTIFLGLSGALSRILTYSDGRLDTQGSITLLSRLLIPVMTDEAMSNLSLVGNILIFCVGINLCFGKKFRVGNYLPGLIIAVAWAFLPF